MNKRLHYTSIIEPINQQFWKKSRRLVCFRDENFKLTMLSIVIPNSMASLIWP